MGSPFAWTPELDELFEKSKEVIVDKVTEGIRLFDPNLTMCLATDFSGKGVGFLMLQKTCSCASRVPTCCPEGWRVCLVGSRFLHDAENRYASIEGECLAVVYGLQKCKYFLMGCSDLVIGTDHKPVTSILNDRCLADIENRRLRNLKEKTLSFKFTIHHVPARKNLGPDAASRYPVGQEDRMRIPGEPPEADYSTKDTRHSIVDNLASIEMTDSDGDTDILAAVANSIEELSEAHSHGCCACSTSSAYNVVSWEDIRIACREDSEMQDLVQTIISGFPEDARKLPSHTRQYNTYKDSLYVMGDVVMLGDRVVVPKILRPQILHLLHAAHQGVDRMKARSADMVF